MHHTQIIKGLLDILNSNHEKMKLTIEQIAVKNEAYKLLKGSERVKVSDYPSVQKHPVTVSNEFLSSSIVIGMRKYKKAPTSEA